MTTLRVIHSKNYTCISNDAIQDDRLSLKARGLHHLLLSFPDQWEVNVKDLVKRSKKDGRDAVYAAIAELKDLGYVVRQRVFDSAGRIKWETEVHELPPGGVPTTSGFSVSGKSVLDSTTSGFSVSGKTVSGKSGPLLSTNRSNTDLESTNNPLNPIVSFADASDLCEGGESGSEILESESQESTPPPIADSSITVPSSEGSAEIVVAAAKKYPERKRKSKAVPQRYPEDCQKLWDLYKQCCYDVSDATNIVAHGDWGTFVAVWDDVVTAAELPQIVEATEYYCMAKRMQYAGKGQAIGIPHCWRYLRDRKWAEALEFKRKKESSGGGVMGFVSKGDLAHAQRRAGIRAALAEFAPTPGGGEDRGHRTIDV